MEGHTKIRRRKKHLSKLKSSQHLQTGSMEQGTQNYNYRVRGDVDNHLSTLYCNLPYKFVPHVRDYSSGCHWENGIYVFSQAIDPITAKNARAFATLIPFDIDTPSLNDTDNPPHTNVFQSLSSEKDHLMSKHKDITYNRRYVDDWIKDARKWSWENYNQGIWPFGRTELCSVWRAIPLTLEAYIDSPIYDLINIILWNLYNNIKRYFKEDLRVGTVVLQRTARDTFVPRHIDNWSLRRISFIYYLTPDDWSKEDGGELILDKCTITPHFNQLVLWKLSTSLTPDQDPIYHEVSPVNAANDRPRLALVGFFTQVSPHPQ